MALERIVLKLDQERAPSDLRRNTVPFLGAKPDVNTGNFGRLWPDYDFESKQIIPGWIRQEGKVIRTDENGKIIERPDLKIIRGWRDGISNIFGVKVFSEIPPLCSDKIWVKEHSSEIAGKLIRGFAQRHGIELINDNPPSSVKDLGPALDFIKERDPLAMNVKEFEDMLTKSFHFAQRCIKTLKNPDTGLFAAATHIDPGDVNETSIWNMVEQLICIFDKNQQTQTRYQAIRNFSVIDHLLERFIRLPEILETQRRFTEITNEFLFKKVGPSKQIHAKIMVEPLHNSVEGIAILKEGEQLPQKPNQSVRNHSLRETKDGNFVQFDQDIKDEAGLLLKQLRKNVIDLSEKSEIFDFYRTQAIFENRRDIEKFIIELYKACEKAGDPLIDFFLEENTLDGGKYEGTKENTPSSHAGSSEKYHVMRFKLKLKSHPKIPFELSCYTIADYADYKNRFGVSSDEYQLKRIMEFKPEKFDDNVLGYLFPDDISPIDLDQYSNYFKAIKRREKKLQALLHDPRVQPQAVLNFDEHEMILSANLLKDEIEKAVNEEKIPKPELIISIDPAAMNTAQKLSDYFGTELYLSRFNTNQSLNTKDLKEFISWKLKEGYLSEDQIMIVELIGDKATNITSLKQDFPYLQYAVSALRIPSTAQELNPFKGINIDNEYLLLPTEEQEQLTRHQSVYAAITRIHQGKKQILIQIDPDGEFELPGGAYDITKGDENTYEAVTRELEEELGEFMKDQIIWRKVNKFPVDIQVLRKPYLTDIPFNTLYLRAYNYDGNDLNIDYFYPTDKTEAQGLFWADIDEALKILTKEGYKKLVQAALENFFS